MNAQAVEAAAAAVLDVMRCRPNPHNLANARRIAIAVIAATDQVGASGPGPGDAAARDLLRICKAASNALRSYQHGNSSCQLAQEVADACDGVIAKAEGRP